MMGHINNMLLRMVEKHHGAAGVARVFSLAGVAPREYQPEVIYPDEEFRALYRGTKEVYGVDDETAQKAFSEYFLEASVQLFPAIFKMSPNARYLLERVPTIHKQWPSAASAGQFKEKVFILESSPERLVYKYDSPNKLCGVLRHVVTGVLRHYKEKGVVVERQCALKGAPWCEVEVRFE
jgi:hypothetical protein